MGQLPLLEVLPGGEIVPGEPGIVASSIHLDLEDPLLTQGADVEADDVGSFPIHLHIDPVTMLELEPDHQAEAEELDPAFLDIDGCRSWILRLDPPPRRAPNPEPP